jgi:hypothetical protein
MVDKSPERNVDGKASHGILRESWQPHCLHYNLEYVPLQKEAIALSWKDTKLCLDGKLFNPQSTLVKVKFNYQVIKHNDSIIRCPWDMILNHLVI